MRRRGFIKKFAMYLASAAGIFAGISFLRQMSPKSIGRIRRFKVGKVSDFPVDTYTLIEDQKIFVYRDHESMKAVSAVCTHLGCTIKHTTEGFECPCHGSCFSVDGKVLSGPAPRALSWYAMEKMPDGSIVVDMETLSKADKKYYLS